MVAEIAAAAFPVLIGTPPYEVCGRPAKTWFIFPARPSSTERLCHVINPDPNEKAVRSGETQRMPHCSPIIPAGPMHCYAMARCISFLKPSTGKVLFALASRDGGETMAKARF